ncbi:hypothetical protein [Fodinicola acaciae]|uniref:hypothetical protein n=1 Tax=Fodinicola acaciae TaxID=2681555 RepID=UPI0013CF8DEB|nr:hypothetical protein [Fodinicola acaciae]
MKRILVAAVSAALLALAVNAPAPAAANTARSKVTIPADMQASYLLFDRRTDRTVVSHDADKQYRSASVVKILLALDYLYLKGSLENVPAGDLARLRSMLRSSDDAAAKYFYRGDGYEATINRMVAKLGLRHTEPPPLPEWRNYWGYTALSASDILRTYQYLLNDTSDPFGAFILDNLGQSTRCAKDGSDQYFGIPSAVPAPFRIKQGWSAFGDVIPTPACPGTPPQTRKAQIDSGEEAPNPAAAPSSVDLTSHLLHTTGLVDHDSRILIVLSLYPTTIDWDHAAAKITDVTRQVYAAGC